MADGLNWYRYANNNPIMYSDPSGLESTSIFHESLDDNHGVQQTDPRFYQPIAEYLLSRDVDQNLSEEEQEAWKNENRENYRSLVRNNACHAIALVEGFMDFFDEGGGSTEERIAKMVEYVISGLADESIEFSKRAPMSTTGQLFLNSMLKTSGRSDEYSGRYIRDNATNEQLRESAFVVLALSTSSGSHFVRTENRYLYSFNTIYREDGRVVRTYVAHLIISDSWYGLSSVYPIINERRTDTLRVVIISKKES